MSRHTFFTQPSVFYAFSSTYVMSTRTFTCHVVPLIKNKKKMTKPLPTITVVATRIATRRRTEKETSLKRDLGVATIVILENHKDKTSL